MPYRDRVSSPGPKKLLALDGGGVRGVITLEVLHRLESMLAEQLRAGKDFVLGWPRGSPSRRFWISI